jgi:non-ribosomal peptide synthetase component F
VAPERKVLNWLKHLQNEQLEMRQYEYSPLLEVQGWSELAGRSPLFECTLAFENYPVDKKLTNDYPGRLPVENFRVVTQTNYPLTVLAYVGKKLSFEFNYDGSRFDETTIRGMANYLERLLREIADKPHGTLADLEMLTGRECEELINDFNADLTTL